MISEVDFPDLPDEGSEVSEASVRIAGLIFAYGDNISEQSKSFMRFYECSNCEGSGKGLIAIFSGSAIVVSSQNDETDEEMMLFLNMNSEISKIRTSKKFGEKMKLNYPKNWSCETNAVMRAGADLSEIISIPVPLEPRESYPLLAEVFGDAMPPFDEWYIDISHRIRHGACRIVGFKESSAQNAETVATAMTVAQSDKFALVGAVATHEAARGKGFGSSNVLYLAKELLAEGKKVFISPKNDAVLALYKKNGFEVCGSWSELHRLL